MQNMLFEVPGLNLGAPKTEAKNTDNKKPNGTKAKLPRKFDKDSSPPFSSKSKGKPVKDTPTQTSYPDCSSKTGTGKPSTAIKSTAPNNLKKIEKEPGKSKLQQKMEEKLRGARFRYLNQKLYQSHSHDALSHFQEYPEDFQKVNSYKYFI